MDYRKTVTCFAAFTALYIHAFAQQGSIKDMKPLFEKLKVIKVYSFENHTTAIFPNGQTDAAVTKVSMDKTKQCLFYSNKGETLLLNRKWVYKANHIQKTAQVFDLSAYNKNNHKVFPALQTIFQYDMVSAFVDSVVMKYGKLLSSKKDGVLTTYRIGFAANSPLKQVTFIYNESTGLPESIYIKLITEEGSKKMQSEIMCNNYKAAVPESVFDEHAFFTIINGKVVLTQYKNYKVYSLL